MNIIPEEAQLFVMELAKIAIPIIIPILLGLVGDLVIKARTEYKTRVSLNHRLLIEGAVAVAVQAAEQSGLKQFIRDTGESKLQYAIDMAQRQLNEYGLQNIDVLVLRGYIEAALRQGLQNRTNFTISEVLPTE